MERSGAKAQRGLSSKNIFRSYPIRYAFLIDYKFDFFKTHFIS